MANRFLRRLSLTLLFLPSLCSAQVLTLDDTTRVGIASALDLIAKGEAEPEAARHYLLSVARTPEPSRLQVLYQVEDELSSSSLPSQNLMLVYEAFARAGADEAFFEKRMRAWWDRKWPAYYAMLVLARSPSPALLAEMDSLSSVSNDGQLRAAYHQARHVAYMRGRYESATSTREKVGIALDLLRSSWFGARSLDSIESSPDSYLSPMSVRARAWLGELSEDEPTAVANAVLQYRHQDGGVTAAESGFAAYVAHFLSPGARRVVTDWLLESRND